MDLFDKYKKAGFDCLFCFDGTEKTPDEWCCGFFCVGEKYLLGDGLICYMPMQGQSEEIRNNYLSGLFNTPEEAINDSYNKWEEKNRK